MNRLPITPVLKRDTGEVVIRPTLGLTAYLADPEFWAKRGARQMLDLLLALPQAKLLSLVTTSHLTSWQRLHADVLEEYRTALSADTSNYGRPRHFFNVRFADRANCPAIGFSYTEIDATRAQRSAVIELTLPMMTNPDSLFRLAVQLCQIGPIHNLVGGYVARWNLLYGRLAFHRYHRWSFRYLGLDIQEPEEWAWHTPSGLPGTNWLTAIGDGFADDNSLDLDRLGIDLGEQIETLRLTHGVLLRAGNRPTLGDVNTLHYPSAYAAVARQLSSYLIRKPPEFWGPFHKEQSTARWLNRFVEADAWTHYAHPSQV